MYSISNIDIELTELIEKNIYSEYIPFKGKFRTQNLLNYLKMLFSTYLMRVFSN